jgi:hypothetical protein
MDHRPRCFSRGYLADIKPGMNSITLYLENQKAYYKQQRTMPFNGWLHSLPDLLVLFLRQINP